MRKLSALAVLLLIPTALLVYFNFLERDAFSGPRRESGVERLFVAGTPLLVEIADSEEERRRGLSGRESLPENGGMFFVFPEDDYHGIWMKEMLFPIDVLWIDAVGRIVHIEKSLQPGSFPKTYFPQIPARFVLEVGALFTEVHGVHVGDRIALPSSVKAQ